MKKNNHIIILGGGIAGLTTGLELAKKGIAVTVIEKDIQVGGLSKTIGYKGFLFDYSAHRFNSDNHKVTSLFKELVGEHCIKREKKTYIRHWGRYLSYPPKAKELIRAMPVSILIPSCIDFIGAFIKSLIREPSGRSFTDWTRGMFGKTLSFHLNEKYAEKIWKRKASLLSSDWAAIRIGRFRLRDFLFALFFPDQYKKIFSKSDPDTDWFLLQRYWHRISTSPDGKSNQNTWREGIDR